MADLTNFKNFLNTVGASQYEKINESKEQTELLSSNQWDFFNEDPDLMEPQREVEQAPSNEVKSFFFGNDEVRTLSINNEPWFVGKDVAKILGYSNPQKAIRDHVKDKDKRLMYEGERNVHPTQNYNPIIINESGLYRLVFRSKLPSAERFTDWVTSEVLPAIRHTGGYIAGEEHMSEDELVLTAMQVLQRKVEALKLKIQEQAKRIELDQPRVLFAQSVENADTCILVGEMAKILNQNGVPIGQNRLFQWLRDHDYLIKRKGSDYNMPTQKSIDLKVIEIKERTINNADGSTKIVKTPKVTGKGQVYFVKKFLMEREMA